jgi:sec-independent protein translocase protein TatA
MHISVLLFLSNLFSTDMLVIVFFALLLFGGEKLPEIARGLGKGIRDFKDASEGVKREINNQINSYEEKRAEEALNKQAEAINQQHENAGAVPDNHPVVENTMPVNEYHFTDNENAEAGADGEAREDLVTGHHEAAAHTEAGNKTTND